MSTGPTKLQLEARAYATSYRGKMGFMNRMRVETLNVKWLPTPRQAVAILKCRAYDENIIHNARRQYKKTSY